MNKQISTKLASKLKYGIHYGIKVARENSEIDPYRFADAMFPLANFFARPYFLSFVHGFQSVKNKKKNLCIMDRIDEANSELLDLIYGPVWQSLYGKTSDHPIMYIQPQDGSKEIIGEITDIRATEDGIVAHGTIFPGWKSYIDEWSKSFIKDISIYGDELDKLVQSRRRMYERLGINTGEN